MALQTDSEQWQSAEEISNTVRGVYTRLESAPNTAYTALELANGLRDSSPETRPALPESLESACDEGDTEPLVSYISSILDYLQLWGIVECRVVCDGDEEVKYYTFSGGMHPVWTVENYKQRTKHLEEKVDRLESQTHDESDPDLNAWDLEQEIKNSKSRLKRRKLDSVQAIRSINDRFNDIDEDMVEIRHDLQCTSSSLASRLDRLESRLEDVENGE